MNVTPFTQQQADDYRTFMQQAARRFIEKHAAEHLDDDGLFERTVSYLVNSSTCRPSWPAAWRCWP